jgi:hypothetical protein
VIEVRAIRRIFPRRPRGHYFGPATAEVQGDVIARHLVDETERLWAAGEPGLEGLVEERLMELRRAIGTGEVPAVRSALGNWWTLDGNDWVRIRGLDADGNEIIRG